jgi:hypothetical protein
MSYMSGMHIIFQKLIIMMKFKRGQDPKQTMGIGVYRLANRIFSTMVEKAPWWKDYETGSQAIRSWKYDSGYPSKVIFASLITMKIACEYYYDNDRDLVQFELSKETKYPDYRIHTHVDGSNKIVTLEFWLNRPDF